MHRRDAEWSHRSGSPFVATRDRPFRPFGDLPGREHAPSRCQGNSLPQTAIRMKELCGAIGKYPPEANHLA